jgi:hypothetical protein
MPLPDRRRCRDRDPVLVTVKARRVRGDRKGFGLDAACAPARRQVSTTTQSFRRGDR